MKRFLNKNWIGLIVLLALAGFGVFFLKKKPIHFEAPKLEDEAEEAQVKKEPFRELIPAFGVVLRSGSELEVEVAVDSNDAKNLRLGLHSNVRCNHFPKGTEGRVARIIRSANAETGQSVAWIIAKNPDGKDHSGEFVWARIELPSSKPVLVIPTEAILIKEGKPYVIDHEHKPVEVKLGRSNDQIAEVLEGLKEKDLVLTRGAIGYLYPDFKASSGD